MIGFSPAGFAVFINDIAGQINFFIPEHTGTTGIELNLRKKSGYFFQNSQVIQYTSVSSFHELLPVFSVAALTLCLIVTHLEIILCHFDKNV